MITVCDKEIEEGNIEYKRYFENVNTNKLYHLTSQMNWRINEGNGICHYYLGVCDNGTICKDFTQERMDYTLDILKYMVDGCNSYIVTININRVQAYLWLDVVIKRKEEHMTEYRILLYECESIYNYLESTNMFNCEQCHYILKIHNNCKYLFFTYNEKYKHLFDRIKFNLCIYKNIAPEFFNKCHVPSICENIIDMMDIIDNNMKGNDIYYDNKVKFNCINIKYRKNYGSIIYGFLECGKIYNGMKLYNNDCEYIIDSIHNNMVDCNNISGPATISIKINGNIDSTCIILTS